jgi:hypothetical protein
LEGGQAIAAAATWLRLAFCPPLERFRAPPNSAANQPGWKTLFEGVKHQRD